MRTGHTVQELGMILYRIVHLRVPRNICWVVDATERPLNAFRKPIINNGLIVWQFALHPFDFLLSIALVEVQHRTRLSRYECNQPITDEFSVVPVPPAFLTAIQGQMRSVRKTNVGGWISTLCRSHSKIVAGRSQRFWRAMRSITCRDLLMLNCSISPAGRC